MTNAEDLNLPHSVLEHLQDRNQTSAGSQEVIPQLDGWRYELVSPVGICDNWSEERIENGQIVTYAPSWNGWYKAVRGTCYKANHTPPHPSCSCGIHFVTEPSDKMADHVDMMAAMRDRDEQAEFVGVLLSRVRAYECLPGAWPTDPVGTHRALRLESLEWLVDHEGIAEMIKGDDRLVGFPPVRYVPDLGQYMRQMAADQLESIMTHFLGASEQS